MITTEEVFSLIKQERNFLGDIKKYKIKISNSNNFERENLIGVYSIREGIAINQKNYKLAEQIHQLLIGLKNDSGIVLKGVTIQGKNYSGMYYLSGNYEKVIGYLESEFDENGNLIN
ncbi:enoyl-CoA hydratase [Chryseobacterium gleum]|uniref:enoyl-CoA hydratase n=1 Tax=Chryseobacterium gleum TaxID=250 RepID=UPI00241CD260|nr:enoyl-CoA hydratase [Chryseobacterium gleum]